MVYVVQFHSYCGMTSIPKEFTSREALKDYIKKKIKTFKKIIGGTVEKIGPGEWEFQEPDDCAMIPDQCGELKVTVRR